jgi:cytoskeleton-associated protein 5
MSEGMSPEEVESPQQKLTAVASPAWAALQFHRDFSKHMEAAEQLVTSLPAELPAVQASLDLILRWAELRICDGGPQVGRLAMVV